jgi:GNAT superfamily N-acetyltransferase
MDDDAVDGTASIGSARVVELASTQTHDLRSRVLRDGTPSVDLVWPGDDLDTTVHLGVMISGRADPVATSTWLRVRSPDVDHGIGTQLRGMATDPGVRGRGFGALLLQAGLARAEHDGADHAWANARSAVLDFYLRHGFVVTSDEFLSAQTAIAHHRILRDLRPR